jgi:hypothetical protein
MMGEIVESAETDENEDISCNSIKQIAIEHPVEGIGSLTKSWTCGQLLKRELCIESWVFFE